MWLIFKRTWKLSSWRCSWDQVPRMSISKHGPELPLFGRLGNQCFRKRWEIRCSHGFARKSWHRSQVSMWGELFFLKICWFSCCLWLCFKHEAPETTMTEAREWEALQVRQDVLLSLFWRMDLRVWLWLRLMDLHPFTSSSFVKNQCRVNSVRMVYAVGVVKERTEMIEKQKENEEKYAFPFCVSDCSFCRFQWEKRQKQRKEISEFVWDFKMRERERVLWQSKLLVSQSHWRKTPEERWGCRQRRWRRKSRF